MIESMKCLVFIVPFLNKVSGFRALFYEWYLKKITL
jgi:hypothetical protein